MKKEILIVTLNWKNIGGTQKRAELLKKNLSKNYNVEHLFLKSSKKFNIFHFKAIFDNFKDFLKYRNKLKEYKVVIAFSNLPSIFSLFSRSNLITVITGSTYHYKEAKFISKIYWVFILEPLIYLFSEKIVPAAPHLIPSYLKKTKLYKKVNYINGLIDVDQLKKNISIKEKKFKSNKLFLKNCMCISSSLIGHKGIIEFIETYAKYREIMKKDALNLIIIGDGPLLKKSIKLCIRLKLKYQINQEKINSLSNVIFTGHLDNPTYIIKKCKLFVMPSFYEGLSNQLLESIYTGTPIIASDCPGNRFIYSEILKFDKNYIESNFLKLIPCLKNKKIQSEWIKQMIFYTKNTNQINYKNSEFLLKKFSLNNNLIKWEIMIKDLLIKTNKNFQ